MVIKKIRLVLVLLVACLYGCSKSELSFSEANVLFKVGMSQQEVEKTYGKPQSADEFTGTTCWTYFPQHKIETSGPGEFSGFIIEFREGRATKITEHVIVKGPSSKP